MKISVIVPIYKVEKYIRRCIESIINQTYRDIEIILVDDGSPDNCPAICDEYAARDNRIKVIHKENGGLVSARQEGVKQARGNYITFVDGDDWLELNMYEKISRFINKYSPDCVITQFLFSFEDKDIKSECTLNKEFYDREEIEKYVFPKMLFNGKYYRFGIFPNCWTKVIKKDLINKHLFDVDEKIRMGEDISFVFPCLMECKSIAFIDEHLYHYRQNPESMTATYDSSLPETYFLPYQILVNKSNLLNADLSKQLPYYLVYIVNFVVRNEICNSGANNKKETKTVLKKLINNKEVVKCAKDVSLTNLPIHTKLLVISLRLRSLTLLNIYMNLLRKNI